MGSQHEKRLDKLSNFAASGDALFLHCFKHGRLSFGRGAVDFIGQDQVGENWPFLKHELAPPAWRFHHNVRAHDIGRHQIGRELNAAERNVEHVAKSAHQQRLAQTGNAFEQNVAACKKGHQRAIDDFVMADDDFADFAAQGGIGLAEVLDFFFGCRHRQ